MDAPLTSSLARHISMRQLQVFEASARLSSITRAAEELFLTQPTVSMQIKKLEGNVGLPLFEQVGKRISLTDAGEALYRAAREILEMLGRLEMEVAELKGLKTGQLRLAVVTTAKYFAPRILGKFCKDYPGIDASLEVTNRERLLERMTKNLDDLYIVGRPPESPEYEFEPYMPNPLVTVAPSTHPLAKEHNIPLSRIADEPFIIREKGSGTRKALETHFETHKLKLNIKMELGSNEAIKQAILGGLGIAVLSQHTLGQGIDQTGLTILDVKGFPIQWQWHVGHMRGKRLSVVARTFLEFLRSQGNAE